MKLTLALAAAILAVLAAEHPSQASLIILGNLPPINEGGFASVDDGSEGAAVQQAISFTMPAQSYPVVQVLLRLGQYNTADGDIAAVGFYLDNGNDLPGALVGNLLVSPPSQSEDIASFLFKPSAPMMLAASTKYWLVVDAAAGLYVWRTGPAVVPTSQVGATFGKQIALVDDVPRDVVGSISSFEIAAQIPEPDAVTLAAIAASSAAFARCRRRRVIQ